jgi:hypothetical protein
MRRYLSLAALVLTAIALIPEGAHVFEAHAKLALDRDQYMIAQSIYRGWAWFGADIIAALGACAALAAVSPAGRDRYLSAFAAFMIALSLAIFFAFVYPANRISHNWTMVPPDWEAWRAQWEWGHLAACACTFAAFLALAWKSSM